MTRRSRPALGTFIFVGGALLIGLYFAFAAVQGDYGVFKRAEVMSEKHELEIKLKALESDVALMENLTKRLSDQYLDLDLLDEQARDVLGLIRADEVVIR